MFLEYTLEQAFRKLCVQVFTAALIILFVKIFRKNQQSAGMGFRHATASVDNGFKPRPVIVLGGLFIHKDGPKKVFPPHGYVFADVDEETPYFLLENYNQGN